MMDWNKDKSQIETRDDGSYVVQVIIGENLVPYHVTEDYNPSMYAEIQALLGEE